MEAALLQHQTTPVLAGLTCPEARTATHDGYIWPVERRLMIETASVRERMAEDIDNGRKALTADQCFTEDDLVRLGWRVQMVRLHAGAAFAQAKAARKAVRQPLGRAA
jgi:hypothetical protein